MRKIDTERTNRMLQTEANHSIEIRILSIICSSWCILKQQWYSATLQIVMGNSDPNCSLIFLTLIHQCLHHCVFLFPSFLIWQRNIWSKNRVIKSFNQIYAIAFHAKARKSPFSLRPAFPHSPHPSPCPLSFKIQSNRFRP